MTTPLPTRAGQLVRLLSSDRSGEAAAAAAALNRTLNACGRDMHWAANVLETALDAPLVPAEPVGWTEMLRFCLAHIDLLDPRSQSFVQSMARWRGTPSAKQRDWIFSLYQRIYGGRQ